jgi:hypothetical protein
MAYQVLLLLVSLDPVYMEISCRPGPLSQRCDTTDQDMSVSIFRLKIASCVYRSATVAVHIKKLLVYGEEFLKSRTPTVRLYTCNISGACKFLGYHSGVLECSDILDLLRRASSS